MREGRDIIAMIVLAVIIGSAIFFWPMWGIVALAKEGHASLVVPTVILLYLLWVLDIGIWVSAVKGPAWIYSKGQLAVLGFLGQLVGTIVLFC